jgi:hypothetical protein
MTIAKFRMFISAGTDQIPEKIIQVGGRTVLREIHKLINCTWNKQGLPQPQKELTTVPFYKKGKNRQQKLPRHITVINYTQNFIKYPSVKVNTICRKNYW